MSCVIFGAGKIARGFIGHLLYLSGIDFTFVEKADALVDLINEKGEYTVNILGAPEKNCVVKGAKALKFSETEKIAEAVANADAVFNAVGGKNLGEIIPHIKNGIEKKAEIGGNINFVTCENWKQPAKIISDGVAEIISDIAADGNKKYHVSTGKSGNHIVHGMDFGGIGTKESFEIIDEYDDTAPYFAAEYWAGNFTNWGFDECTHIPDEYVKKSMNNYVDLGASFNIYMVFGGTNFGFTNGAQGSLSWMRDKYNPVVTSYDYDAAITEWCGYTQRYFDIKEAMERDHGEADVKPPKSPKLCNIGKVDLTQSAPLFENLHIGRTQKSVTVEPMEEYDQISGYILYSKTMDYDSELNTIKLKGLHDRAHVFVNGELIGIRLRGFDESVIEYPRCLKKGDKIDVLVENMGRICYGEDSYFGDRKGIDGAIILTHKKGDEIRNPGKITFNWDVTNLELDNPKAANYKDGINADFPVLLKGKFKAPSKESCFVHFDNLKKGVIFVNGFNIGRYWEKGPLNALYIPGVLLKEGEEKRDYRF